MWYNILHLAEEIIYMAKHLRSRETWLTAVYGLLIALGLYLVSLYSYLLFHALVELFITVVACGIFMIAWNARRFLDNTYLLFIGIAYLFVAFLELLHTLAYKGMGAFPGFDSNLPTQLWIAARYVESLSLLLAPLLFGRKLRAQAVFVAYVAVVSLLLASIFLWNIFPDSYVEGAGQTAFKRISEYVVASILLVSAGLVYQRRRFLDVIVLRWLIASILLNTISELVLTLYSGVYDLYNLFGHLLKLLAFYLIYKAVIETSLVKPYDLLFRGLKHSEEALRQRSLELQARNRDLDAFAHTVAHDLKTPLGIVVGYAELLVDGHISPSDEEGKQSLDAIVQNGLKMSGIIDEMLLLSEMRGEEVKTRPLDMASIVAEAQKRLGQAIAAHNAQVVLPAVWPVATGHAPWVEEVWVNYLSNAIRYGGRPPRLELGAEAQPNGMVRFWVRDNGAGISREEQAELFKPFARLAGTYTSGHGLGLSIVRRIVEKLGGQVGVESEEGKGSVFSFTLPAWPNRQPVGDPGSEPLRLS
jgi:signal transduction histidine kinase